MKGKRDCTPGCGTCRELRDRQRNESLLQNALDDARRLAARWAGDAAWSRWFRCFADEERAQSQQRAAYEQRTLHLHRQLSRAFYDGQGILEREP